MQVPKRKSEARRPRSPRDYRLSEGRYLKLKADLKILLQDRLSEAKEVKRLAEMGDFSENAGYQLAKHRLRTINRKILEIEDYLKKAEIIQADPRASLVELGHRVELKIDGKLRNYLILGSSETNPSAGVISANSPLGSALLNRRLGEKFKLKIAGQEKELEILKIIKE